MDQEEILNKEVTLEITVGELNSILSALMSLPYKEVTDIITKLYNQGQSQVAAQKEAPVSEDEK
jgi:hypothetical protein